MPSISVIITTRNRTDDLGECLDSLVSQLHKPEQVIIVDQSDESYKHTTKKIAEKHNSEHYFLPEPRSLTICRNFGVERAKCDVILFLDDDVILEKDFIENLLLFFDENPGTVGVTGLITNNYEDSFLFVTAKVLYKIVRSIFLLDTLDLEGYGITPVFEPSGIIIPPKKPKRTELLSGANMCYRADITKKKKFDGRLLKYSYKEDMDFSFRARKFGELWLLPQCKLIHKVSKSGRIPDSEKQHMLEVYSYYLFCKNFKPGIIGKLLYSYSRIGRIFVRVIPLAILRPPYLFEYFATLFYILKNSAAIGKGETREFVKPSLLLQKISP